MKRLYLTLLGVLLSIMTVWAQTSPEEYNPTGPGDPGMPDTTSYYVLTQRVFPPMAGYISGHSYKKAAGGKKITLYANAYSDYTFICFRNNDGILSEKSSYTFNMPYADFEVEAVYEYTPSNLKDPESPKVTHRAVFNVTPDDAGHTNYKVFSLAEGETKNVSAYNYSDYKFKYWMRDGMVVSAKNPMTVTMADEDQYYTAVFEYSPDTPGNPNENSFNSVTGELLVDYFAPGYLRSRMEKAMGKSTWSDVEHVIIKGEMNQSDAGFSSGMTNVTRIDMSAVTGLTSLSGNTFSSCGALTELTFPASLTRLYSNVLLGCSNLSELTCLALAPPTATSASFAGLPEGVVLHVPAASVSLYKMADGWKDFFQEETLVEPLSVSGIFPDERDLTPYVNMHMCLYNRATAKVTKQVIEADRRKYLFPNVEKGGEYELYIEDRNGRQIAKFSPISVEDSPRVKIFNTLPAPKSVNLKLLINEYKDYAYECDVRWIDEKGMLLGYGSTLEGVYEGDKVTCRVIPTDEMIYSYEPLKDTVYVVGEGDNNLVWQLEPVKHYMLRMTVLDEEDNQVEGATVQVNQRLSTTISFADIATTNENGQAEFVVYDTPLDISVSATDMRAEFLQVAQLSDLTFLCEGNEFGGVYCHGTKLKIMSQAASHRLNYSLSYSLAVTPGSPALVTTPDYSDLILTMFDETDTEITDFTYTANSIYMPQALREYGKLRLHVASRNDRFEPIDIISADFSALNSGGEIIEITGGLTPLFNQMRGLSGEMVEHGGLKTSVFEAANNCVALLYKSDGTLHTKLMYDAEEALFENLKAGSYKLVSMVYNPNFATVYYLDDLLAMGLKEGRDYVLEDVEIVDGVISEAEFSFIPTPVEEEVLELPTVNTSTYFAGNKNIITVGNPLTLRAKVTIKSDYSALLDHVNLVVTLPEGVDFVENSVVSAHGLQEYQIDGQRVIIPLKSVLTDNVRFCVMPTIGGDYVIGATLQYLLAGKSQIRSMGMVTFAAEDITINTPITAHKPHIGVSGIGPKDSKINIFDNDRLAGVTYSNPGGDWHLEIDLHKPYHYSRHEIRAEVDFEGHTLRTPTLNVDYSDETPVPALYTMIYNGKEYLFDPMRSSLSEKFYTYTPDVKDFTFVVDFTENDSTRISNVVFQIFNSDGTISEYNGRWQPTTQNWATTMEYPSPSKVPLNVKVQYMITPKRSADHSEPFADQVQLLYEAQQAVRKYVKTQAKLTNVQRSGKTVGATLDLGNGEPLKLFAYPIDYEQAVELMGDLRADWRVTENGNVIATFVGVKSYRFEVYFVNRNTQEALCVTVDTKSTKSGAAMFKVGAVIGPDKVKEIPNVTLPTIPTSTSGGWFNGLEGFSSVFDDVLAPAWSILTERGDFSQRVDDAQFLHDMLNEWSEVLRRQVYSRWNDGYYCLPDGEIQAFAAERHQLMKADSLFQMQYRKYITKYRDAMEDQLLEVLAAELALLSDVDDNYSLVNSLFESKEDLATVLGNELARLADLGQNGLLNNNIVTNPVNHTANASLEQVWSWSYNKISSLHNQYRDLGSRLSKRVWSIQKWGYIPYESFGHWKSRRFPLRNISPIIDPSGYVYEAVEGNRLEGVTATIYYRQSETDMFGDKHEQTVLWNAQEYGQKNPLITGADGMYQWDVPEGMWQVKFEKQGYETTYTEWLPVPPPQLEINIPMVANRSPEVTQVHAYTDKITVEFDRYMKTSTLIPAFIKIWQNDVEVKATVNVLAADSTSGTNPEQVTRSMEIIPATTLQEGKVKLFMSQNVSSYTGRGLDGDFMEELVIEPRITAINTVNELRIAMGETLLIEGAIESAAAAQGKELEAVSSSDLILSVADGEIVPDAEGRFSVAVTGKMMGRTSLRLSVPGYDVSASVLLNVIDRADYATATPVASLASGTFDEGTEVTLSCSDAAAQIYYTLDGTTPTTASEVYDGTPLRLETDTELRISACNVEENLYMSDVVSYSYAVIPTAVEAHEIQKVSAEFSENGLLIIKDCTAAARITVYALDGNVMAQISAATPTVAIQCAAWPAGLYLLQVESPGTKPTVTKLLKP